MDLMKSIGVSTSGMNAQSARMQVISENIANAESIVTENGGPYRRKLITFESMVNRQTGLTEVQVKNIKSDYETPLNYEYQPHHPLADSKGFLAKPNVSTLIEKVDMRDAARAYEANMAAIESAKAMMVKSLDLLK
ncbi:MAG: flagellar basal-body rod protein FlgC [Alphaproteobacteria bacterium]|jgi:flagellar basal-body rod protein FlgC